ncbi:MAG: SufD family Fe-S cluster assembly protein, partial [Propionibacteriaceae bacterium]|nr:SufD family Fe-S cluster assembly protein [Propionibacteriaceae bacterium]
MAGNNLAGANGRVQSHLHPTASFELGDHGVPLGREEIWRFTPLEKINDLLLGDAATGDLAWDVHLPAGVTCAEISESEAIGLGAPAPMDRIAAVAASQAASVTRIDIPRGGVIGEPIVVNICGTGQRNYQHLLFTVGELAQVTIVLKHTGSLRLGALVSLVAGASSQVNFVSVQDWDADAVHAAQFSVLVGRNAQIKTAVATVGGSLVRLTQTASFDDPGGRLEQYGMYFVDEGQHIENRLFVDHNAPHTASKVDYRGALQGEGARSVWVGDVLIRKVAEGIDTYESNKNLLLTHGCRADSVPNLEIETGEIQGAGHSSTTGRFDDE